MLNLINRALVVEARCFSTKRSRSYTEGLILETISDPKYPTLHKEAAILMSFLTLSALVNDRKYKCIKWIFSTTVKKHTGHWIRWLDGKKADAVIIGRCSGFLFKNSPMQFNFLTRPQLSSTIWQYLITTKITCSTANTQLNTKMPSPAYINHKGPFYYFYKEFHRFTKTFSL